MTPKFEHDCDACDFLGTYLGCDVYTCGGEQDGNMKDILARYGNDGPEYSSYSFPHLRSLLAKNHDIEINVKQYECVVMPYQEFVFSEYATDTIRAIVMALAIRGVTE